MRRSHFLRSLLGAALLAVLLTACGSSTAPTAEDPGPSEDPQGPTQTAQPSITGLSTTAAPRGSTLVITGLDLGEEGGTVIIGGAQAAVTEWSDTAIQVAVPEGAPNAWQDVTVTTEGGSATQPGLFVGAEFLGDDHELLDFLGQQPAGSAVLLGARTYDLREEDMFLLDNVDLHGRGAGETELQFPDGGALVLADYGHVTHIVGLSTSGGPLRFAGGTAAGKEFPLPGEGEIKAMADLRDHVAELATLASPPDGLRPTIVLRDLDIGQGLVLMPYIGNYDLEVHESNISTPETSLHIRTTGDVILDGVTASSSRARIVSLGGSLQVMRSDMRFEDGYLAAGGGMMISDSALTAENGNLYIAGDRESIGTRLPGGPITVTRSSLKALDTDPEALEWRGELALFTTDAPITLTDNPELVAHGDFFVETDYGSFGETGIEFARNASVRANNLYLSVYESSWVTSHVNFSDNDLSIADTLRIDGVDGYISLDFSGNTGVIGDGSGQLLILGNVGGTVAMNGNDLQVASSTVIELRTLTAASFSMTDNLLNETDSLSSTLWISLDGFEEALISGNEVSTNYGFGFQLPNSEAVITGNRFSAEGGGLTIDGSSGPSLGVTINHNVFDIQIGEPGSAVWLLDVADTIDARHNVWGTATDVADVEAAVLYSGDTEALGGQVLLDPIALP